MAATRSRRRRSTRYCARCRASPTPRPSRCRIRGWARRSSPRSCCSRGRRSTQACVAAARAGRARGQPGTAPALVRRAPAAHRRGQAPPRRPAGVGRPTCQHQRTRRARGSDGGPHADARPRWPGCGRTCCRLRQRRPATSRLLHAGRRLAAWRAAAARWCARPSASRLPPDALFDDAGTVVGMAQRIEARARRGGAARERPTDDSAPRSGRASAAVGHAGCAPGSCSASIRAAPPTTRRGCGTSTARLDVGALRAALAAVAARQPMLRTRFVAVDGEPRQVDRRRAANSALEVVDLPDVRRRPSDALARAVRERAAVHSTSPRRRRSAGRCSSSGPAATRCCGSGTTSSATGCRRGLLQERRLDAYAAARAGQRPRAAAAGGRLRRLSRSGRRPDARRCTLGARSRSGRSGSPDLPVLALPDRLPPAGGAELPRRESSPRTLPREVAGRAQGPRPRRRARRRSRPCSPRSPCCSRGCPATPTSRSARRWPAAPRARARADHRLLRQHRGVPRRRSPARRRRASCSRARATASREMLAHQDAAVREAGRRAGRAARSVAQSAVPGRLRAARARRATSSRSPARGCRRASTGIERAKFDLTRVADRRRASGIDAPLGVLRRPLRARDDRADERGSSRRWSRRWRRRRTAPVAALPLMDEATTASACSPRRSRRRARIPADATIHRRFAEQVRARPAGAGRSVRSTTTALDAAANRLARELRARGVGAGAVVAVAAPDDARTSRSRGSPCSRPARRTCRSIRSCRAERLAFMLADARVAPRDRRRRARRDGSPSPASPSSARSATRRASPPTPRSAPDDRARPDDPAYVIYTSGSTGAPKGVVIPHRAVLRLVCGTDCAQLGPDDTVAQIANPAFDASTFEFWGALLNGARHRADRQDDRDRAARARRGDRERARDGAVPDDRAVQRRRPRRAGCVPRLPLRALRRRGRRAARVARRAARRAAGPPAARLRADRDDDVRDVARGARRCAERRDGADRPSRSPNTEVVRAARRLRARRHRASPARSVIGGPGLALGYLQPAPSRRRERFVERAVAARCRRGASTAPATARAGATTARSSSSAGATSRSSCAGTGSSSRRSRPRSRAARRCARRRRRCTARPPTRGSIVAYVVAARTLAAAARRPDARPARVAARVHAAGVRSCGCRRCRSTRAARSTAARCRRPAMPRRARARRARPAARHVRAGARPDLGAPARRRARSASSTTSSSIGGHSLLAARLVDEIERETGLAVPLPGAVRRRHDRGPRPGAARRAPPTSRRRS